MIIVEHKVYGQKDFYQLESFAKDKLDKAIRHACGYVLNHGGYVRVRDQAGTFVYYSDPVSLGA